MPRPLDSIRLIRWVTGANLPSELPIHDTEPDPGIFGPGSITWRLHKEQWLIAAGGRAFLMQAAHPVVAQGALDHSRFAEDPYGRVYNTVHAMVGLVYGTTHEVNAIAHHINRLHHAVTGTLRESAGRHIAGSAYGAMDPQALLWVHAVFVDSILSAYISFVGPLTDDEREQYWQESRRYAHRLGLGDDHLPPSYAALRAYMQQAIADGEVAVGAGAREIAQTVLYPPISWYRRPLWAVIQVMTLGQLPDEIRRQYGIRWDWRGRAAFRAVCALTRLARRLLPRVFGQSPVASYAERRVAGALAVSESEAVSVSES